MFDSYLVLVFCRMISHEANLCKCREPSRRVVVRKLSSLLCFSSMALCQNKVRLINIKHLTATVSKLVMTLIRVFNTWGLVPHKTNFIDISWASHRKIVFRIRISHTITTVGSLNFIGWSSSVTLCQIDKHYWAHYCCSVVYDIRNITWAAKYGVMINEPG